MSIDFDTTKLHRIKEDGQRFFNGTLDRPFIFTCLDGKNPQQCALPRRGSELQLFFDNGVSSDEFVEVWEQNLSDLDFLGDGFPYVRPMLASSAMAVYSNCNYMVSENTIWFEPSGNRNLNDIEIQYNPDSVWLKRTLDVYATAAKRWGGKVQLVMTNLGGVCDILAMIIPSEEILYAMYDQPEQIKRLIWQIHKAWWQYYDDLSRAIRPYGIGYMDFWLPIPCQSPTFLLQCDFCSVLNEALFDEFVKPELEASCRRLGGAMFHLDGPEAIRHLDSLLSIDSLKVIQWVPGDWQKEVAEWPELYKKVRDAGKQLFVTGSGTRENFDKIVDHLGSAEGLCYLAWGNVRKKAEFETWLMRYGVL